MYNERNEEFSIRDIVLQLLFVVLFVFILLWLFPTKGDINKLANKANNNISLEPVFVRIFNENVLNMKDAGKDYFTIDRVPKKVGDKVNITLGEMLDKKLLLPFVDSKGRQCDLTRSYIEVTKVNDTEYTMKVNLNCTDASDYILVPMGCYNFCKTDICEKEITKPVTNPSKGKDPVKPVPNKPKPKPDPKPTVEYLYEYSKTTPQSYTSWSRWSDWGTTYIRETDLVDVRTDVIEKTVRKQIAIKEIRKEVPYTVTERAHVDNLVTKTCAKWDTVYVPTGTVKYGTEWNYSHTVERTNPPKDTSTTRYVRVKNSSGDSLDCTTNCNSVYSNYKVYTRETYQIKQGGYTCVEYGLTVTPIYINKQVTKYKTEVSYEPVYGYVKEKITYYQSRTRKIVKSSTDKKWSKYNDTNLLNNGYKYTGNKKQK